MDSGGLILIVLTVLGAALILGVGLFAFSRLGRRGSGYPPTPCAFRTDASMPWRKGHLIYDAGRLDHHGPGGLSRAPEHRWRRVILDFGIATTVDPAETPWLSAPVIGVPCEYADERFELALGREHYTALRSWLESVPPGWNSNVA